MTPQEQELVNELFDRLAKLEGNSRDQGADRLIADGLKRAPHAVYALVQTALVQDEALKRANARIEELQAQTAGGTQQQGGFLDSMRDAVLGKREARYHQCDHKHNLHPQRLRPIDRSRENPRSGLPILRVPVWRRGWARLLVRADRFSARPHRRQRA